MTKLDLATLNTTPSAEEGSWLELEHPVTGEPLDIHIKLAGTDSDHYQKQLRKQQDKRLKKGFRKTKSEELENEGIELLVACTLEWKNVVHEDQELQCDAANVRWLYKNYKWIKEAVDEFVGDRSNFLLE